MIATSLSRLIARPASLLGLCALATVSIPSPVAAQGALTPAPAGVVQRDPAKTRRRSLVRRDDALLLAGALAASAVVSHFDGSIAAEVREPELQQRSALSRTSALASSLGDVGPLALGVATYAAGRATGRPELAAFGREATTAVLGAGALTFAVKGVVGRTRPMAAAPDADTYRLGRGFFDASRASFPSGHTGGAFALATVIASEPPRDRPLLRWGVGALAYGGAGLVGLSRVYGDRHWASDVITGAALGTIAGRIAVRREHASGSALDQLAEHASVAPEPGRGVRLSLSLPLR